MIWLWFAFFASGIAGISYELIWLRSLVHLFGASTPAVSSTVAIFFAGLALGALLGGWVFGRIRRSLLAYGLLELLIGVVAAAVPALFQAAEGLLIRTAGSGGESAPLLFALSALVMLTPCTLLGATFPAMAAVVQRHVNAVHSTSSFYGYNTLGAVSGCLLISFYLLPRLGAATTNWIMAGVNLSVGLFMIWRHSAQPVCTPAGDEALAEESESTATTRDRSTSDDRHATAPTGPIAPPLALVLAGGSGFLAIGIEVLWTRALALSFPGTIYIFATVLASFLAGIGLGSLLLARFSRRGIPPQEHLSLLYVGAAAGTVGTLLLFPRLMGWVIALFDHQLVSSWSGYIGAIAALSFLTMLPATLCMGAALPLLIGLASSGSRHPSRVAGALYGLNMAGGIAGSLTATFLLMPRLGLSPVLMLLALVYLALALPLARQRPRRLWIGGLLALSLLMLGLGQYPEVNPLRDLGRARALHYKDAPSATVSVIEHPDGVRALRLNNHYGLSQTTPGTVAMQYRLGHLPLQLHPRPVSALLIGFATGTTLAAMADHRLERLDCVELHPMLFELAPLFSRVNREVYKRPDVRLIAADGRRFLLGEGTRYDVIVGDLYLPRNAGVGALFSQEHFQAARGRLSPKGIFVAWLPLFQLGPGDVAIVLQTFLSAFPRAFAVAGHQDPGNLVLGLVGRQEHLVEGEASELEALNTGLHRAVAASMRRAFGDGIHQEASPPYTLRVELTTAELKRWAGSAPLNTLKHPRIEYAAPRSMIQASLKGASLSRMNHEQILKLRAQGNRGKR